MCGIAGSITVGGKGGAEVQALEAMARIQAHRGPDDAGSVSRGGAWLGHRRLAIIDLTASAHQPMSNEDASLTIVHNGEVYNYRELRAELITRGVRFRSQSDTEVILKAYEEWGEGCLGRFNGMWSFAILDERKKALFCARDRFGVKPFYYFLGGGTFAFASEIKSLLVHPRVRRAANDRAVLSYLSTGYGYTDVSDETFFSGVRQLKPAHYAVVSLDDGSFTQKRYWDLDPRRTARVRNDDEACRAFYELFEDAVRLRLRSDVPVGVSLSGGLDSSAIACVAARLAGKGSFETFSSCFEDGQFDERAFIAPVLEATGARSNLVFARPEALFDEIKRIIWHQDEPYSTSSIFPQWYVMRAAREKGVKVLLSGQGGDETLAGYHKYFFYLFADLINSFRWSGAAREIGRYRALKGAAAVALGPALRILLSYAAPAALKRGVRRAVPKAGPGYLRKGFTAGVPAETIPSWRYVSILNNDLYHALKISPLPSLLRIDDRSSMAHSVETRSPFLDYRLVEYLFSLGPEYKIREGLTKYVLRMSMKGVLPEAVRMRRDKMGFVTPLEKWLKGELKEEAAGIFSSREFARRPYFEPGAAARYFKAYTEGAAGVDHYTIWSWLNLELWFRAFIDQAPQAPGRP